MKEVIEAGIIDGRGQMVGMSSMKHVERSFALIRKGEAGTC